MSTDRMIQEFCHLVEIDSPSFGERAMADYLTGRLTELGFVVEEDQAGAFYGGTAGNLYAHREGSRRGDPLLFSMHMDTVEPSRHKRAIVHWDGRITSQGDTVLGADDLSAVAAFLEALEGMRRDNEPCRELEALITIGEEQHLRGSAVFDYSKLRSCQSYVLDLSGRVATAANKAPSLAVFRAKVIGRAAHAGFAPEEGIHAIVIASRAVLGIPQGHVGDEMTVNVGRIDGGSATNVVPDQCIVTGEVRGFVHSHVLKELDRIRQVFEQEAEAAGGCVEYETEICFCAYETPDTHPVVKRFERACERAGICPVLTATFGGSDQHHLSEHGIAGMVLASAMHHVHSCGEYTTTSEMEQVRNIVREIIVSEE